MALWGQFSVLVPPEFRRINFMFLDFAHSSTFAIRDLPIPFFQVYNFILVSARKELTKDILSSIFDKKSVRCRVYSTKIVINGYYKRQKNKKRHL